MKVLVKAALDDSRLLIFVDGLDEWSNEVAARTAIALLEQFVGEREVPAIATSRPLGFERLGGLSGKWRRVELAGLTIDQQREFSTHWFLHKARQLGTSPTAAAKVELHARAGAEAKAFIEELQRENRLARLGEVPLLLSGLIALSAQSVRLPRNRFKAYQELTRLLLQEQPQRREKAAHARGSTSRISPETRERALARLAFAVHQSPGSDSIGKDSAQDILRSFLADYLRKSDPDALEMAKQILAVGAETIGILVEKSPHELGFPHRAFQEFLAARHLKDLRFEEQKQAFGDLFGNPQWHDALLCLCHLNTRSDEVDSLVEVVQAAALPIELEPARRMFLAEVAFDDLNCSASCASQIAQRAFAEIETGATMPLRETLLDRALDGLFSDVLRQHVEARIQTWYPDRFTYRSGVYKAMVSWPRESATIEALWRGLLDEEEWNQRPASEAIAESFSGDGDMGERLLQLILTPNEPRITAYALHSLCTGWPSDSRIPGLLQSGRRSVDPLLQIVAVCHRVKRRDCDQKDREILLSFAKQTPAYHWRSDGVRALLEGWPRDSKMKRDALQSILKPTTRGAPFSHDAAGQILFDGFPQDDEVAATIAELFRTDDYPQHRFGLNVDWLALVNAFKGHHLLVGPVDDWLEEKSERFWECQLCLLTKSPRALAFLTKPSEKTGTISEYQARWLVKGWGMRDPIAAKALTTLAESEWITSALHLLPSIVSDKEECRKRLLEHLRHASEHVVHLALMGLIELGANSEDTEVANAALERFAGHVPCGLSFLGVDYLIAAFPAHPSVRELAIHQIQKRGGSIGVVARAYGLDAEMRKRLLTQLNPLPGNLRLRLVDRLATLGPEDDFAYKLLKDFDEDTGELVKTAGAIGLARSLRERTDDERQLVCQLTENLHAVGPDNGERRQAAFAGLLELDRMDVAAVRPASEKTSPPKWEFSGVRKMNLRLASHLAKHWDRIRIAFGATFWDRVGYTDDEFLEELLSHTSDENLVEEILARLDKNKGDIVPSVAPLRVRSKQWGGTERLRRLCLDLVTTFAPSDWNNAAPGILAAEVLGEQFAHDDEVRIEIEAQ
ncbi:MAG: hypothetical protein NT154_02140, partial [Verrucomicrobia bacterium]|nr:hypothetical protein [Verrucomicrobiota bacterium]